MDSWRDSYPLSLEEGVLVREKTGRMLWEVLRPECLNFGHLGCCSLFCVVPRLPWSLGQKLELGGPGFQPLLFKAGSLRSGKMSWGGDVGCLIGPRLSIQ